MGEHSPEEKGRVAELIALSIGNPTEDRVARTVESYLGGPHRILVVAKVDGQVAGCIGVENKRLQNLAIFHLAVFERFRRRGVARALLEECIRRLNPVGLEAETDDDAIAFYRRSGFEVLETFENEWKKRRFRVRRLVSP